ncbi:hypothetical protein [Parafrankia sp. BMG5.11]|uniref:hypothetical protein n=1 Tax=Parafrankia sp. BMG5.11 TaxID=222540 RepID=UPI001038C44C|nr:hypothetical protein [Parafrankia sp. BMG5.11]TCJ37360.1 hypothetical protein E0504_20190 [Parafrankia sp. BMG5.11]
MIGANSSWRGYLDITPADAALYKEADRLWFEARPSCNFRLRTPIIGEPVPEVGITHVVLKQMRPGFRQKLFLILSDPVFRSPKAEPEEVAMALWLLFQDGSERVPTRKILELAKTLADASRVAVQ